MDVSFHRAYGIVELSVNLLRKKSTGLRFVNRGKDEFHSSLKYAANPIRIIVSIEASSGVATKPIPDATRRIMYATAPAITPAPTFALIGFLSIMSSY